ncbi:MAG: glycosyl transferase family 1 [Bacteroidetes bacterium]|nr:MAG: glycosyl transferase family 1 [Bacteroidota bacterium]
MKKILFIVPHRKNRSPGQRFRFEQYLIFLSENGYKITFSNIISEKDDKLFYSKKKYFSKFIILIKSFLKRIGDVFRLSNYDAIFIYREAFMLGTTIFEKLMSLSKAKIIYDFDDAIWLNDVSDGNENLKWLKKPGKTAKIIKYSDLIFAGNKYLSDYAKQFNHNVKIIPTTIDTNYHKKRNTNKRNTSICIGWTGTSTTLKHFETALPMLREIKQKYGDKIYFKLIVDFPYSVKDLNIKATQWNLETEIEDLCEFDIGIMPLPNDKWAKGKCGFKGLQYMALEIPTIMSPVGVNTQIINDGGNGFLAETNEQWLEKLSALIESNDLREKLGKAGRQTIIKNYSVDSQKIKYLNYFNEIIDEK